MQEKVDVAPIKRVLLCDLRHWCGLLKSGIFLRQWQFHSLLVLLGVDTFLLLSIRRDWRASGQFYRALRKLWWLSSRLFLYGRRLFDHLPSLLTTHMLLILDLVKFLLALNEVSMRLFAHNRSRWLWRLLKSFIRYVRSQALHLQLWLLHNFYFSLRRYNDLRCLRDKNLLGLDRRGGMWWRACNFFIRCDIWNVRI